MRLADEFCVQTVRKFVSGIAGMFACFLLLMFLGTPAWAGIGQTHWPKGNHQWRPVEGAVVQDNTVVANMVRHFTVYAVLAQPQKNKSVEH